MVPDAYRAHFTANDAVVKMAWAHDIVHAVAREGEREEILSRIDVEDDSVEDFRGLSRDRATRGRESDERLDDVEEVK